MGGLYIKIWKRGNKMKKIIAVSMAVVMTLAMLTGCGVKNDKVSEPVNLAVLNGQRLSF